MTSTRDRYRIYDGLCAGRLDDLGPLDPTDPVDLTLVADGLPRTQRAEDARACLDWLHQAASPNLDPHLARHVADTLADAARTARWAKARARALAALSAWAHVRPDVRPVWRPALEQTLTRETRWTVRASAIDTLPEAVVAHALDALAIATTDPHWRVRNALVLELRPLLPTQPELVDQLRQATRSRTPEPGPRTTGLLELLELHRDPASIDTARPQMPAEAEALPWLRQGRPAPSWWDDDPAVVLRNLRDRGDDILDDALSTYPQLLGFEHEAVRRRVLAWLHGSADAALLAELLVALRPEPRLMGYVAESLETLTERLDMDRREDTSRALLLDAGHVPPEAVVWALERVGTDYPLDDPEVARRLDEVSTSPHPEVRRAAAEAWCRLEPDTPGRDTTLARLLADDDGRVRAAALTDRDLTLDALPGSDPAHHPEAWRLALAAHLVAAPSEPRWLQIVSELAADPMPRVRMMLGRRLATSLADRVPALRSLHGDPDPRVRAASLTPSRARALWDDPRQEPSWAVLDAAAGHLRKRLRDLRHTHPDLAGDDGDTHSPRVSMSTSAHSDPGQADDELLDEVPATVTDAWGARLGISGHYGLPEVGYAQAFERGVRLFIWEPNYLAQTRFFREFSRRHEVCHLVGTFEADAERIRRDIDRALRALRIERIGLFQIFWARSRQRLDDEVIELLEQERSRGRIGDWGVSTHQRDLAVELVDHGIDPIMVRHNAAHRGAETSVLPAARAAGARVITFSTLMYGRMLERPSPLSPPPPSALDCYRYSLSQPGVRAVLSAPPTLEALAENLDALDAPPMSGEEVERIRAFGDEVVKWSRAFARLVRWR